MEIQQHHDHQTLPPPVMQLACLDENYSNNQTLDIDVEWVSRMKIVTLRRRDPLKSPLLNLNLRGFLLSFGGDNMHNAVCAKRIEGAGVGQKKLRCALSVYLD